ncbi:MAG TPA: hypothetical protein VMB73_24395 [Acetobacteraceae bacterium]|jgi:hypothetical protein|nr:hypothetical protein [Acetobacteraceae bacterium]
MMGSTMKRGMAAGLAGGAAEILWIAAYTCVTGTPAGPVARGVTDALAPQLGLLPSAPAIGIALHMLLAVGLGIAVATALRAPLLRAVSGWSQSLVVVLVLGAVWSFNFLVLLPGLDPAFVTLLPMAVTLVSKLLFGVSAAAVLRNARPARVSAI